MKEPNIPHNESARLSSLRSLNILDTQAEERFDRLTRLAKRMFDVPIALVSLVDENRQWFKSCIGVDASETGRDISFCGHTILGDGIFIIKDAREDIRFADNPLVTDAPNIRFYAGCPIQHLDGSKLGTLCIIDTQPRELNQEDMADMRNLAEMVESEIGALKLATMDDLTGISNRRGFTMLAEKSLSFCARQGLSSSLVYFDLDKFKEINDNFGHNAGDTVLKMFSEQMAESFRESDVFGRLGGDEFVLLLNNTSEAQAELVLSNFQTSIDEMNRKAKLPYNIEFSRGVVTVIPDPLTRIEDLLMQADAQMYVRKHNSPSDLKK